MSFSALSIICNIQDPGKASLLSGFYGTGTTQGSLLFRNDINALTFWPVLPSSDPSRFWDCATIDPTKFVLGIGRPDAQPTAGTWAAAYQSDAGGLTALPFNPTASALTSAFATNTAIIAAGGVTFIQIGVGAFEAQFTVAGGRDLITTDPGELSPQSNVFVSRKQVGDVSTKEIQIIQILQRPYVYVTSWALTPSAASVITTLSNGSGSSLASYLVTLAPIPYAGTFTLTIDGTPFAIPFNCNQTDFKTIIGGNWTVTKISTGQWSIISTVNAAHTMTADPTGLSVYIGLVGTLSFNAASLLEAFLSASGDSITANIQARFVDGSTEIDTLLFSSVTLTKDILSAAAIAPTNWNNFYYTSAQVDALFTAFLAALPANILAANFASIPTSNPGGGKIWSNGGVLQVGA